MAFLHIFFPYLIFAIGCQGDLPELQRAIELQEKGNKLKALQMYEDIIERYPNHESTSIAKEKLENIYNETANKVRTLNPEAAYIITNAQLELFPKGEYAKDAENRFDDLEIEKDKYVAIKKEDNTACKMAKKNAKAKDWNIYLDSFPNGDCSREAKEEIRRMDSTLCSRAQKGGPNEWREYLQEFPSGKCAEEAKGKSKQVPLTPDKKTEFDKLISDCSRKAQKCQMLQDRFNDIIIKGEIEYLTGPYYSWLSRWLETVDLAKDTVQNKVQNDTKAGFDMGGVISNYETKCADICATNYTHLSDILACQEAKMSRGVQQAEKWEKYLELYPKGGCSKIAKP